MKISHNTVAAVSFVATDENGQVIGRTEAGKPIIALMGHGYLVPGLEKAIDGHERGEELSVTLNPADAYGEYDESLLQSVSRDMFGDHPINEGDVFEAEDSLGRLIPVVIKKINETTVDLDSNHPLAGKTITFIVNIEDVREATQEEIAHGHAHINGQCPSESHGCGSGCGCGGGHHHGGDHECCGGHHHGEDHECCGGHHHGEDHECCGGHHHGEDHECCGGHHHCEDHECCGGHHHGEDHECCGGHHHDEDHECCGGHHHDEDHECCGGKGHGEGHGQGHGHGGCGCGRHNH